MANQLRARGGRGATLGVLSGRLRGGFTASPIPGSTRTPRLEQRSTSPLSAAGSSSISGGDSNQEGNTADIASQLAIMSTTVRALNENIKKMDRRVSIMEQQQSRIMESLKELSSFIKNNERKNFTIKGSTWEIPLKEQAALLFCHSLTREPSDTVINEAVAGVVGRVNMAERHKIQVALRFLKSRLSECRSEERRKVLGLAPYKTLCFMSTRDLAVHMMRQMHAPEIVEEEVYVRHLALFRKFVRLSGDDKTATYNVFRQWMGKDRIISEEEWISIMEEDEAFDYASLGVGRQENMAELSERSEHTVEDTPEHAGANAGGILQSLETEIITGGMSDNDNYD